jgi:hypothetical protein
VAGTDLTGRSEPEKRISKACLVRKGSFSVQDIADDWETADRLKEGEFPKEELLP